MICYEQSIEEGGNGPVIYYISDLHFGHARVIDMDKRPFASIEEMDATLISRWNERVAENDDVYIVGDFAYRNGYSASWYLRRLKGKKHLLIGNHDRHTLADASAVSCIESIDKMMRIVDGERAVSLCHFPIAEWNGKRYGGYHVFGHLHTRRDDVYQFMSRFDHALNAGCMLNGYMPVTLDELIENNALFRQQKTVTEDNGAELGIPR